MALLLSYNEPSKPERLILHGTLVAGSIIFAFPFVWMVGTSAKVRREMAAEKLQFIPQTPRPQDRSPYIDSREFERPEEPDGVPPEIWETMHPEIATFLRGVLRHWEPRPIGADRPVDLSALDADLYQTEMLEGLFERISSRISDQMRLASALVSRQTGDFDEVRKAFLEEVRGLINESALQEVFEQVYRRFCLGGIRVRTRDFKMHSLGAEQHWNSLSKNARLRARVERGSKFQEAALDFTGDSKQAIFEFRQSPGDSIHDIDRVYISYRGDATWARAVFEVAREGRIYESRGVTNLFERDWMETQLRWPEGEAGPMERKAYLVLHDLGAAGPQESPLVVRIKVTRNSQVGAWLDKITNNYRQVFREVPFSRYILTSVSLSILNIVLAIFSCTLVGYAFARLEWPGRNLCFGLMLATMMIPGQVTMIPGFLVNRYLGWYNTLLPLWVHASFGSAFFVFLLRQFFRTIPQDLEDAARIDGCGFLRIYWHVMLPLVKPTIATIAIYTFIGVWNNFMGPLIYVNDERLFPLALGLFRFNLQSGSDVGLMMAGSFIMTLPIIILFFFAQRYFIQGISLTGMKA